MGINKQQQYSGYTSFSYLDRSRDFREFELVEGLGPFPAFEVPLSDEEAARADELAANLVMISLHEHPHVFPKDMRQVHDYDRQARCFTAYEQLAASNWDAVFDNFQDGTAIITSKHGWKWDDILYDIGMRLCDLAHQDFLIKCESVDDILRAHETGHIALIPAQEGAAMIENELDRLEILYGIGLRALGIAYSESNALGTGLKEPRDGGLTSFGHRAVTRMNEIGMAIDCSHSSPQTAIDTAKASTKPIILSHIGARALWDIKRLAPDEVLKTVAGEGGLIGIEAAPHTTLTERHPHHNIESFMEHFEYTVDLVGIEHVGFGPDTLYGDHVGLHHAFAEALSISSSHEGEGQKGPEYEEVTHVEGVENPTESSRNILRWLVKHNYSDEDIARVLGGNAIRFLKEVWQ